MADDYRVDMRPLDKPVNPFGFAAARVRERHPKLSGEDLVAVEWLEHLAAASPDLKTGSAAIILLVSEAANFLQTRQTLTEALAVIEREIEAAGAA